ncbi:Permease of the drug/metabolite transporter (DMT) superfamily [Propionivibrio dicarboxylicus]|uniref:Permease of the drug/metabolite transporter (DMT) superfamily n=1 Tax=Propionivibrio dicarboxylicus TaxID=83767 RepID=A0A1G8K9C3_9RHOO|nr:Permease of the drug/metabolite transporter (DMT) superfamily [Propionivibrio dicarboxylicus]
MASYSLNPALDAPHPIFSNRSLVFALATLCCLFWGSSYPAIKGGYALFEVVRGDIPSTLLFAGWRFTLAGLVLLAFARIGGASLRLSRRHWQGVVSLGLGQTTVHYVFFYVGLANTTGVKSSVLNGAVSFFGVFLAHFFVQGERVTLAKVVGCIVGFLGVLAVNFNPELLDLSFTLLGEGFVLIAAFIMAAGMVHGKSISRTLDSTVMTGYQLFIGGSVLLFAGTVSGGHLAALTPASAALMAFLVFNSSVALSLWSVLLKYNGVGMISVFNFLVPIFGALLSAWFLNESVLEWKNLLALLLVCSGIWLVNRRR